MPFFCKILPEAKSVFVPLYNCFLFLSFFCFPKNRWREMCKSSMFSLQREEWKKNVIARGMTLLILIYMQNGNAVYLSHSQRMFVVSLDLGFLAILLHFLLQFLLLLRRPILLLTRLPASLPVSNKRWWPNMLIIMMTTHANAHILVRPLRKSLSSWSRARCF